jgi:protein-tyrosine phosphatase
VIDLHCHVLPGIDDGPPEMEGSVALARRAQEAGIHTLVATPHVNSRYENEPAAIARLVDAVNERLAQEGVAVGVLGGAELAIGHVADLPPGRLELFGLGGGPWLLVEPPFTPVAVGLESLVLGLLRAGHRVVLAHPERCPAFHRERRALAALAEAGVLMSITAGSLTGRFGREVRRFAGALAAEGLIHNVTSDAHDAEDRPPGLLAGIHRAGLEPLADWLTREVPEAILAGEDAPPRPPAAPSSRPRRMRLLPGRR